MAHRLGCSAACGIFPDKGSNPCPLHWQADSYPLRHQGSPFFIDFFKNLFYLPLAVLGLHCCMRVFSSCSEWGLLFVAVRGLLIAVASLVGEHGL